MYMLYDSFFKNILIKLDDDRIVKENSHQMEQKKKTENKQRWVAVIKKTHNFLIYKSDKLTVGSLNLQFWYLGQIENEHHCNDCMTFCNIKKFRYSTFYW